MPAICFYFQVHQPYRLRRYSYFDVGGGRSYFNDELNRSVMERVAKNCYIPANRCLLKLIKKHRGNFKVTFSLSGTAIEQMRAYAPAALDSFKELAATGAVEFLAETYYHSLAMLFDQHEYREQIKAHVELIEREFKQRPTVLRNTELLYSDFFGQQVRELGFDGVLAEGVDDILGWRSPNFTYRVPGSAAKLLLKNYKLSDDIAFRFSDGKHGKGSSLRAEDYVKRLFDLTGNADLVGLFLDYETFGEHHKAETGIFDFLTELPSQVLSHNDWQFMTPTEAVNYLQPAGELSFPRITSWADSDRDSSAWCGGKMQQGALDQIYQTQELFSKQGSDGRATDDVRETWRRLQTSDHFYYMCAKGGGDGDVHSYFSPFESPYDAFITYMNILKDFTRRCQTQNGVDQREAVCNG